MRILLLGLALSLTITSAVRAQDLLTESEAVARLSSDSPRIRALLALVALAEADARAVTRFPNPRVTFSREAGSGVAERYGLISQPLPITGRRGLEGQAAAARVRATALQVDALRRRAEADLRLAWVALREREQLEDGITDTIQSLRDLSQILRNRELAGDVAGYDRLRIEREVLDVETDRAEATAARMAAQAALAAFFPVGTDPRDLRTDPAGRPAGPLPTAEDLLARLRATNAGLLSLRQAVEAAQLDGRAIDRRLWPEPEVVGGVKSSTEPGGAGSVFSVTASLPLFDRFTPERARAEAEARRAEAELEHLRAGLEADVLGLRNIVEVRRETAGTYRREALQRSTDLQRIARLSYDAGERTVMELLDAHRTAMHGRLRLAQLDAAIRTAEIELEFVSGWETLR